MSTNFTGDPLSDQQIVVHALRLRRFHGLGDLDIPDVVALLDCKTIFTRFGEKYFDYQVVDDEVLGGDEAVTLVSKSNVRLRVSRTTYDRVASFDRRGRMTIAHEGGTVCCTKMQCLWHAPDMRRSEESLPPLFP